MRKPLTAILLVLTSASFALSVQTQAVWIKHTSTEGRYSVLLPSAPTIGTQESATADGEKFTQHKATLESGNAVFLVGYFDHVPGTVFSMDKARDGMVAALKSTLLSDRAISLGDHQGREWKMTASAPDGTEFLMRARSFDIAKRVYVLQFIIPKAEDDAAAAQRADKFFDSFQVTLTPQ